MHTLVAFKAGDQDTTLWEILHELTLFHVDLVHLRTWGFWSPQIKGPTNSNNRSTEIHLCPIKIVLNFRENFHLMLDAHKGNSENIKKNTGNWCQTPKNLIFRGWDWAQISKVYARFPHDSEVCPGFKK